MQIKYFIFLIFCPVMIYSCSNKSTEKKGDSSSPVEGVYEFTDENLARMYCSSCHIYPEPTLLDKNTWKYSTLPQMGYRMGIYGETQRQSLFEANQGGILVKN